MPPLPLPFLPSAMQDRTILRNITGAPPACARALPGLASLTHAHIPLTPLTTGLLKLEDNGAQLDAAALLLIQRIASSFPLAARQLLQMGMEDALRSLKPNRSPDLHQLFDSTLSAVISSAAAPPSVTATPYHPTSSVSGSISVGARFHTGAASTRQSIDTAYAVDMSHASLARSTLPTDASHVSASGSTMAHGGPPQPLPRQLPNPVNRPLEHEFASAAVHATTPASFQLATLTAPLSAATSAAMAWSPAKSTTTGAAPQPTPSWASRYTGVVDSVAIGGSVLGPHGGASMAWPGGETPASTARAPNAPAAHQQPVAASHQHLSSDARAVVSRLRADRGVSDGPTDTAVNGAGIASVTSSVPPHESDWLLPSLSLGAGDEQYLFDLVVRMKYLQDPVNIVGPALQVCVCVWGGGDACLSNVMRGRGDLCPGVCRCVLVCLCVCAVAQQ